MPRRRSPKVPWLPVEEEKIWRRRFRHAARRYLVVLEGVRAVQEALEFVPMPPRVLFIRDRLVSRADVIPLIRRAGKMRGARIWKVSAAMMKRLSTVTAPPGLLGCWKVPPRKEWPPEPRGYYAYFHALRDPGNLGTVFRTALAAGIRGVFLAPGSVSVFNPKVTRSSMSAVLRVPFWLRITPEDLIRFHQRHRMPLITVHPDRPGDLSEFAWPRRGVLIFGGETEPLPELFRSLPGVRIPMAAPMDSLNTAVAAALVFYACRGPGA